MTDVMTGKDTDHWQNGTFWINSHSLFTTGTHVGRNIIERNQADMIGNMNNDQVDYLLHTEYVGRIGCHAEQTTYVVPIHYVFDGKYVYAHTREGMKVDMMRKNHSVCFEVDHIQNTANWQSAIVWGEYEELAGAEAEHVQQQLINRMHPFPSSDTSFPRHSLERPHDLLDPSLKPVVFRIKVKKKSGKFEKH